MGGDRYVPNLRIDFTRLVLTDTDGDHSAILCQFVRANLLDDEA
jgi:hypothetical protein